MAALLTMAMGLALVTAPQPTGRWVGQDGHDYTSTSKGAQPSGYQDIRFSLGNLPPHLQITKITIGGDGGGIWNYPHTPGGAAIAIGRSPGARTADLYIEPYMPEKGRVFFITLVYDDGSKVEVHVRGGKADPNLRMPDAAMTAKWIGQERKDIVGTTLGVGPDGLQDVHLSVAKLDSDVEIKAIEIEGPERQRWQAGLNLKGHGSAEFLRDPKDRSKGDLYFQPERDFPGKRLRIVVLYANDRQDSTLVNTGRFEPNLPMPTLAVPTLVSTNVKAQWLGQDGTSGADPGDVHVSVTGLPSSREIAHAVLSDSAQGNWIHRANDRVPLLADPYAGSLTWRPGKDRSKADLYFSPHRDETKSTLTLRLVFADGSMAAASLAGGTCDLNRKVPAVAATSTRANPEDDLNDLANRFGTVTLGPGTYRLVQPLVLRNPVKLVGEPGAVLLFDQGEDQPLWTTAIKIHAPGTTLRGFQVRFAKPVRWRPDVSYGPAVIGTTDNLEPGYGQPRFGLEFTQLDIESAPVANLQGWEESPRLMRLMNAGDIHITKNRIKGGVIEFFGGPVECVDNDFRGTAPGTFSHGFIVGHNVHDLIVRGNRAQPVGPSGKVWRFLVITGSGHHVRIEENRIQKVGPRDDDTIPWANAPEIILTESYRISFEGRLAGISNDSRIVRVPLTQGETPRGGDFVSVLSGPHAGRWTRIAQTLTPTSFLLESPLPSGSEIISIANGFADFVMAGNLVDSRGGQRASNLVLAGNHYGSVVRNNRFMGGEAFRLLACPTESPMNWGWTHTLYLSGLFDENVIEDSPHGGIIAVEHSDAIKSNAGRTYMTLTMRKNTVRWTEPFLREFTRSEKKAPSPGLKLGSPLSRDPSELLVAADGEQFQAPAGTRPTEAMRVEAAIFNGRRVVRKAIILPVSPLEPAISRASSP